MESRGPDDAGLLVHRNAAFAHRRLAIRDVAGGAQPWLSDDGRCVLVYNGEIYNDGPLRRRLEQHGHSFRTRCDTEVVMAAWLQWGPQCVERLRGMFAFGVYDFQQETLFLARDRFGVKPLFFAHINQTLAFASSLPALLRHPEAGRRPNFAAISHYLTTFRLTLHRDTLFEGIQQLRPAETLTWRRGKISIETYWDYPTEEDHTLSYTDSAELLRSELNEAVRSRLVSDVPVGMFLSGGVDSSTLACLIRGGSAAPMIAKCGGGPGSPDFAPARRCAEHASLEFDEVCVTPDDYLAGWDHLLEEYQTPLSTPSDVILFRLASEMKKSVGVVIGGEGADELLCGYAVQHWAGHDFDLARQLSTGNWRGTDAAARAFACGMHNHYGQVGFSSKVEHYFALNSLIPSAVKPALLQPWAWDAAQRDDRMHQRYADLLAESGRLATPRQYLNLLHRVNLESLLARLDSSTMLAGLEARVPYTDHQLVEKIFRVPMRHKIDVDPGETAAYLPSAELQARGSLRSKRILRSVAERLMPASLAARPKTSFPTPVGHWLGDRWQQHVRDTLTDSPFAHSIFQKPALDELAGNVAAAGMWLWPILNVVRWGDRQFEAISNVGQPSPAQLRGPHVPGTPEPPAVPNIAPPTRSHTAAACRTS